MATSIGAIKTVPRSRILDLMMTQCRIFSMTYNPDNLRTGNKILRQRLKGPALAAYYPAKGPTFKDLRKAFPFVEMWDEDEEDRLEHINILKQKGKARPKKRRGVDDSKKNKKKK